MPTKNVVFKCFGTCFGLLWWLSFFHVGLLYVQDFSVHRVACKCKEMNRNILTLRPVTLFEDWIHILHPSTGALQICWCMVFSYFAAVIKCQRIAVNEVVVLHCFQTHANAVRRQHVIFTKILNEITCRLFYASIKIVWNTVVRLWVNDFDVLVCLKLNWHFSFI